MITPFIGLFDDLSILELFLFYNIKHVHFSSLNLFSFVLFNFILFQDYQTSNSVSKHEY